MLRSTVAGARTWSEGRPPRIAAVSLLGAGVVALLAWAWWPSGQYQPIRPTDRGTLPQLVHLSSADRPAAPAVPAGTHLAVAMIPVGGPSRTHPAMFVFPGTKGHPATAILSTGDGQATPGDATAFPFTLPSRPGPGGTQALALNSTDGSVLYQVAYALVTVQGGQPVSETNSAYAIAHCRSCTTVAVSFQVVLVVGQSKDVAPIDAAGALNYECPACTTTAMADQMIITIDAQPSQAVLDELQAALSQLNALPALGAGGTPQAVTAEVTAVQNQVQSVLASNGLLTQPSSTSTTVTTSTVPSDTTSTTSSGVTQSSDTTTTTTSAASSTTSTSDASSCSTTTTPHTPAPASTTTSAPATSSTSTP